MNVDLWCSEDFVGFQEEATTDLYPFEDTEGRLARLHVRIRGPDGRGSRFFPSSWYERVQPLGSADTCQYLDLKENAGSRAGCVHESGEPSLPLDEGSGLSLRRQAVLRNMR